MIRFTKLLDLNPDEFMVIDLDSGTVLGTNVVVCRVPDESATPGAMEDILNSDSTAHDYGMHNALPVYVSEDA